MIVTKIGGSIAETCPSLLDELASHEDMVLVHGFGPQTTREVGARGIDQRIVTSPSGVRSRLTDGPVLEAMQAAAMQVGQDLVEAFDERGRNAVQLGAHGHLVQADLKPALRDTTDDGRVILVRGNRSGRVADVETDPIERALAAGELPVVTPMARDDEGLASVDGDRAAAQMAGRLGASTLVLFTDVPGLLEDPSDPGSRIDQLTLDGIDELIGDTVTGGMVRKLIACREALEAGVPTAVIASGLVERPLEAALAGQGTEVVP